MHGEEGEGAKRGKRTRVSEPQSWNCKQMRRE